MKKYFCLLVVILVCCFSCTTPSQSDSTSNRGSSGPAVASVWKGASLSTSSGTNANLVLTIYVDNTFSGTATFTGGITVFSGSGTMTPANFTGTGTGTTSLADGRSDQGSSGYIGTITSSTMNGTWATDYAIWPDEVGTFTVTKQ